MKIDKDFPDFLKSLAEFFGPMLGIIAIIVVLAIINPIILFISLILAAIFSALGIMWEGFKDMKEGRYHSFTGGFGVNVNNVNEIADSIANKIKEKK